MKKSGWIAALGLLLLLGALCAYAAARWLPAKDVPQAAASESFAVASSPLPTVASVPVAPTPAPTPSPTEREGAYIASLIDAMSLEEQVRQLFMIRLGPKNAAGYDAVNENVLKDLADNRPGGYVLFTNNIASLEETRALTDALREHAAIPPLIAIDEEGGSVSRLGSAGVAGYQKQPSAGSIGKTGDPGSAYEVGKAIGEALFAIGVDVDFAPVADVLGGKGGAIGNRSFGSDPKLVADMVSAYQRGLGEAGILSAPKHFPGHGAASGDSHDGYVSIAADEDRLREVEYPPFERAIAEDAAFVLVGHIAAPNADPSGLPATLSEYFVTDVLRGRMGFEGVAITDAMDMGAIVNHYSPGEASVRALTAGIDMVLLPKDYPKAVEGVLAAIEQGALPRERVNEALTRVFRAKVRAGLIKAPQ